MQLQVDLNCDMGESYGRWSLGQDAALVHHVTTASVASGFHAGDPTTIRRAVSAAVDAGCRVGAHVSLPDLMGFGRRYMAVSPSDLRDYCLYQIGAVAAFVEAAGGHLNHVKPHGALYVMADDNPDTALAIAQAVADYSTEVPLFVLNSRHAEAIASVGVTTVSEGFPDINYSATGSLIIEPHKQAWSPDVVAARALAMVVDKKVPTVEPGTEIDVDVTTVCIHGDSPNAVEVAQRTRQVLEDAGVLVTSSAIRP